MADKKKNQEEIPEQKYAVTSRTHWSEQHTTHRAEKAQQTRGKTGAASATARRDGSKGRDRVPQSRQEVPTLRNPYSPAGVKRRRKKSTDQRTSL